MPVILITEVGKMNNLLLRFLLSGFSSTINTHFKHNDEQNGRMNDHEHNKLCIIFVFGPLADETETAKSVGVHSISTWRTLFSSWRPTCCTISSSLSCSWDWISLVLLYGSICFRSVLFVRLNLAKARNFSNLLSVQYLYVQYCV